MAPPSAPSPPPPSQKPTSQMRITTLELTPPPPHQENYDLTRAQLLILTCTLGGLQVIWSILNGNINVFLLSIGIPASISPLIWVIAPLCGTVVQPLVGWMSDSMVGESMYGRRKPFVAVGAIATVLSLLGLSFAREGAEFFVGDGGGGSGSGSVATTAGYGTDVNIAVVLVTVIWVILLNLSIQPLQMGIRALIMDGCAKAQQPQANAWAGCAASIGNVFGYMVSFATARMSVHVFGFGHFKYLAVVASVCLSVTVLLNLWLLEEDYIPATRPTGHYTNSPVSLVVLFRHFRRSNLVTSRTRIINRVQFCAWMGWFPFLFYMTVFVASVSSPTTTKSSQSNDHNASTDQQYQQQQQQGQPGALAGFLYALISCIGSLLIPQLLKRTKYASAKIKASTASPIATLFGLSLEHVWFAGQIFFGILMFTTVFAVNSAVAITLIACAGVPWALANYIPFALLGVEVAEQRGVLQSSVVVTAGEDEGDDADTDTDTDEGNVVFGTGATIGLHNAAISAPQIVAALVSAAVIAVSGKLGVEDGVGWVMRLSGVAALVAAWQIKKLFQ